MVERIQGNATTERIRRMAWEGLLSQRYLEVLDADATHRTVFYVPLPMFRDWLTSRVCVCVCVQDRTLPSG